MKKLVVFDLDGTLADTISDLGFAVNFALKENNLPTLPMGIFHTLVGNGMEDLVRRSMGEKGQNDELYLKVRKDFDEYYDAHSGDNTVPYEGIAELLSELESRGILTAVLTNKAHQYVGDILEKCFENHSFTLYRGQQEGIKRKPHPEALRLMLNELNCSEEDCLYIGDSEVDVKTAINANVDLVAVSWGYRTADQIRNAGASVIVSTPREILNYV